MPDVITPDDQLLIMEAEACGRITYVKTGTTGEPQYLWNDVLQKPMEIGGDTQCWGGKRRPRQNRPKADTRKRQKVVRGLLAEGKTLTEISKVVGVSAMTVSNDRLALKYRGEI